MLTEMPPREAYDVKDGGSLHNILNNLPPAQACANTGFEDCCGSNLATRPRFAKLPAMNAPRPPLRRQSAFTLIELLVVVVIVAILAAVSIPVFNVVKVRANASRSTTNLRSLGQALVAYQGDHDGAFPAVDGDSKIPQLANWVSELVIAMNDDMELTDLEQNPPTKPFVSPALAWDVSSGKLRPDEILYTYAATDALIGTNYEDDLDPKVGRRPATIEKGPETILLVEAKQAGSEPHCSPWIDWSTAQGDLSGGADNASSIDFRYRDRFNALMADYSVQNFDDDDAAAVEQWHWSGSEFPDDY